MATSNPFVTSNQYIKYTITVTQNSRNISANTSNVTVSVRFYRTNTGYTTYGTGTVYCKINGTTYSEAVTPDDKITSSGIVLFTKTLNIPHNADGSKTLTCSAWISHERVTSDEKSYVQVLTSIPRATTPTLSASSVDMGASITISMPRASSSFTHTLTYTFGGTSGTIGTGLGTSKAWTVPLSLASQIPNTTSGTLTIKCQTFNGSTSLGITSVTMTIKVPASVKPSISNVTFTENVSGLASKFGAFIKNKSEINVAISASGSYSSTIKSYSTKFLNVTYSGQSFTLRDILESGSLSVVTTVTDSRGRTTSITKTISVLDYTDPVISTLSVSRCNADKTLNDEGEYILIAYAFTVSPIGDKNGNSYTIAYKASDATSYTTLKNGNSYSENTQYFQTLKFDVDSAFDIKLTVADHFKTVSFEVELPTAFTLVDYHQCGKAIAFGKVSSEEYPFDVNLRGIFRKGFDYVGEWTPLTLGEEFGIYNDTPSNAPMYKTMGCVVSIKGVVSPFVGYTSSNTKKIIASGIPEKYRPSDNRTFVCQGSGMNRWSCSVEPDGTVRIARYGTTEMDVVSNSAWLTFNITYMV